MPSITDVERVLHHIRVKLYPNYLPNTEGAYFARTDSDKTLSMEEVCAIMKTRAGFTGKLEDLIDYVHQYNDEVAYQLCDGFAVNNGYYSIYPNIGGTFNSVNEAHNQTKNPISFRFGIRSGLRKLIDKISVDITGLADTSGWIDQFIDTDENWPITRSGNSLVQGSIIVLYRVRYQVITGSGISASLLIFHRENLT